MKEIQEVIVVEGLSDKRFLESFLKADILVCNGSANDGFTKEFLINLANTRGVIILTDPDYPGSKIRQEIESYLPTCKHAFVRKEKAIRKNKVGVAEASAQEVLRALENVVTFNKSNIGTLKPSDLLELHLIGPNSNFLREKVVDFYKLGHCNGKTLLKRLNYLNVTKKDLEQVIHDK